MSDPGQIPPDRVFVVIVTMGDEACERQIRAVRRNPGAFPVLVLNGCAPDRVEVFRRLIGEGEGACVVLPENRGGSGGFRAGMQYVLDTGAPDSQFVWLLDDDAEIDSGTLPELVAGARLMESRGEKWGAVGSMIVSAEFRHQIVETGADLDWRKGEFLAYHRGDDVRSVPGDLIPCRYCAAASLLTRVEILRKVGLFADVFLHFDDVEWCFRMTKAGYRIVCAPKSTIHHPTNRSKPATWVRYYDAANFIWIVRLYRPELTRAAVRLQRLKGLYFRLHGLKRTANLYTLGIRDGLRGEKRLLRGELDFEDYVAPGPWRKKRIFASAVKSDLARFRRRFGAEDTRFLYLGHRWPLRIPRGLWLMLYAWTHPRTEIIVGDGFRSQKQVPVFFRRVVFYNPLLDRQVDLR